VKVTCQACNKDYELPDNRLPWGKTISFPCPGCKHAIKLDLRSRKPDAGPELKVEEAGFVGETDPAIGQALKKKIIKKVKDLPPMPQIVHKAREVMANPNSSFKDLAIVLVTDQAIATRTLKMANSAYYGLSGKVSSIQHASVVLGQKTLAELLTMAATSGLLNRELRGYGMEAGDLWRHSLAVAFGSRILAKKKRPGIEDSAFSAGLIHDSGKLVLDSYLLERKDLLKQILDNGAVAFHVAEKKLLGFDHSEIAAEVCKQWNIPAALATAIKYHHHPALSQNDELAYILYLADVIAMRIGLGTGAEITAYESCDVDEKVLEFLGIGHDDLDKTVTQVTASVQKTLAELGEV
jgi:HD-like signal output (HDOD) protein